jgi:hypothetical protein
MICTTCKAIIKQYKNPKSINVFCDHKCYSKFKADKWKTKNNPRWRGGDDKIVCKICKTISTRKKYGILRKSYYCSIKCAAKDRAKNQIRDKHWNWKGGNNSRSIKKIAPRPRPERCEVCNGYGNKNGIVLDHNHKTGKFRGWLCSNCNTTLGLLKEDPQRFDLLKAYLLNNENLF